MARSVLFSVLGLAFCSSERTFVPIKINNPINNGGQSQSSWHNNMNTNSEAFRPPNFHQAGLNEMFPFGFVSLESLIESLSGQSISLYHSEYEWLIFFAERVEQQKWGQTWTLGIFDKFGFCGESSTDICMWYTDGTPTAANVKRSTRVKLDCGVSRLIDNIEEPQVGHYEMTLYLPSFCDVELEVQNQSIDHEQQKESSSLKLDSNADVSSLSMIANRLDRLEKKLSKQWLYERILKGCFLFLTGSLPLDKFPEDGICDEFMSYVLKDEEDESIDDIMDNGEKSSEISSTAEEGTDVASGEVPDDVYGDVTSSEDEGSGGEMADDSVSEDTYEDVSSSEHEIAEVSPPSGDDADGDIYGDVDSGDEMVSADVEALEEEETETESVIKETTQSDGEIEQPNNLSDDTEEPSKRSKKKRTKAKATSKLSKFDLLEEKQKDLSSETGDSPLSGDIAESDMNEDVESDNEMASADFGVVEEEKATESVIIKETTQSDEEITQPSSPSKQQSHKSKKKRAKSKSASKRSKITQLEDKRKNLSSKTRTSA